MLKAMLICSFLFYCTSCQKELLEFREGDLRIHLQAGENWLHDFPLFLGIKTKNAPQIAIWLEDPRGKYLSTIYVSHKAATQSWSFAGKNRRKESLPCWAHSRGVKYEDGLYLPTKAHPLTDAISGATPNKSFDVKLDPVSSSPLSKFVVKIEINHSIDFNDFYPKTARKGDANYSGGKMGSGQPAVVYAATIDLDSEQTLWEAQIIGHSSPDGSDGKIDTDLSTLTSALNIIKKITLSLEK